MIVAQLLQTVALVIFVHRVLTVDKSAEYADASSTGSTYRTRLEKNQLAVPLLERETVLLAKLGLKVIALPKIVESGTLVIVAGIFKASALLEANVSSFIAHEQE